MLVVIDKQMNIKYGIAAPWDGEGALKGLEVVAIVLTKIQTDASDSLELGEIWHKNSKICNFSCN